MSAYLVEEEHINYLVNAALSRMASWHGFHYHDSAKGHVSVNNDNAEATGQMLWDENAASVDYRYKEENDRERFRFRYILHHKYDPAAVLKAIHCYEYQACEHPGWETSAARAFCKALEGSIIRSLPGYDDAPWGVPENAKGVYHD